MSLKHLKVCIFALLAVIMIVLPGCTPDDPLTDDIYSEADIHAKAFYGDGSNLTGITGLGGTGDMEKATYDPDEDGIIDQAQLDPDLAVLPTLSTGSALVFKPSGDNDDYFTFSTVSNVPSIFGTGAYVRIGDVQATRYSLASEDDLMASGKLEVEGEAYFSSQLQLIRNNNILLGGNSYPFAGAWYLGYQDEDSNARGLQINGYKRGADDTAVVTVNTTASGYGGYDFGLFDGLAQTAIAVIDNQPKYSSATNATSAGASPTMTRASAFGSSVVGDIVRVTAGTNAIPGWYYITAVTDASNVDLDRNWCTDAVTGGTYVAYHSFTGVSAEGLLTRITDGAPTDSSVEIDRDGWLILDVSQANGRLYWRANNAWHYVDATGGVSLPAEELIDKNGHEFQVGDTVTFYVDRINDDGSFHAMPVYDNTIETLEDRIADLEARLAALESQIKE